MSENLGKGMQGTKRIKSQADPAPEHQLICAILCTDSVLHIMTFLATALFGCVPSYFLCLLNHISLWILIM